MKDQRKMRATEDGALSAKSGKKAKKSTVVHASKYNGPRRNRHHRSAMTRRCLSRSSKILYRNMPSWFLGLVVDYEHA